MKDLNGYLKRMADAVDVKLTALAHFDIDKYDYFFDFGCADASMIARMRDYGYKGRLVGYDKNWKMLEIAAERYPDRKLELVTYLPSEIPSNSVIFLGSILHEVTDIAERLSIFNFAKQFDVIIIRDMAFFQEDYNLIDIAKIKSHPLYSSFEDAWGNITLDEKTLYHFLLKYHYEENWETENMEDYFSVDWEWIWQKLSLTHLAAVRDSFQVEYIVDKVKRDFGYEMKSKTHRVEIYIKRGKN